MMNVTAPIVPNESRRVRKIEFKRYVKDFFFIIAGVLSAAIGLESFLLPNSFLDGGVTGISLLTRILTNYNLSLLIVAFNIPFIIISIKQVSKEFAFKTTLAIIALAVAINFIRLPILTDDKLLIAVFGGVFLGAGIGFSIRGGAVIDGTEVLAIYASKNTSLTVGDFIALFNLVLFSMAALLVSVETAMYSILTYLAASKTVDFIVSGIEEYIGVTIISTKANEVQKAIIDNLGRAVTVYKGQSGYGIKSGVHTDIKILFCVITRLEVSKLLLEIDKIDSEAFVVQHTIKDTRGGMIKKRPLH